MSMLNNEDRTITHIMRVLMVMIPLSLILGLMGCKLIFSETTADASEPLLTSVISQQTYSYIKKHPNRLEKCQKVADIVSKLGEVPLNAAEFKTYVVGKLSAVEGLEEYSLIIGGLIDSLFTKYKIKLTDDIELDAITKYITIIADGMQTGIDTYTVKASELLPDEVAESELVNLARPVEVK